MTSDTSTVYHLIEAVDPGPEFALKVMHAPFREPSIASVCGILRGLRHQGHEATQELSPARCVLLALLLARVVAELEERQIVHTALSPPNVIIAATDNGEDIELVGLEDIRTPSLPPCARSQGAAIAYRHPGSPPLNDEPGGDRFALAILVSEILTWHVKAIRENEFSAESYFDLDELQAPQAPRYQSMLRLLEFCPAGPVLASCDSRVGQLALYRFEPEGGVELTPLQSVPLSSSVLAAEVVSAALTPAPGNVPSVSARGSASQSVATLPVRFFLSYAHEDRPLKETLRKFLRPLERAGMISIWDDRELLAGAGWDAEILRRMQETDVFLMLVTAAAIASDYIVLKELDAAMAAHRNQQARVIPIVFESCAWKETALRDLQALPRDARPVSSWDREDEAYQDIVEGIQAVIADIVAKRPG